MSEPIKQEVVVQLGLPGAPSRREAMQWVLAAVAASALPATAFAEPVGRTVIPQETASTQPASITNKGYGPDPRLVAVHQPGAFWPLTFNDTQRKAATSLADTIIPQDQYGPAASAVGVVAMIDEWISAPYPTQQNDRPIILNGLAWLDAEAKKRFTKTFAELPTQQQHAVCDDICFAGKAKKEFREAAKFFSRFRSLCAGAYYATPAGWKAIGYVGNTPLPAFDGPPPEVLNRLGVVQTVK